MIVIDYNIIENISLNFEDIEVFKNFSLSVPSEKITCIVGPSGCGKTTLLNVIAGFVKSFDGKVNREKNDVGYIFQEDRLLPWETVYENIAIVKNDEYDKITESRNIDSILDELDLSEFKNKYPEQLSGGMKQRCALGRGFYFNPKILLMDEPYKSLDYDLKINLIGYLVRLWEKNKNTIVFVTHDIDEALLIGHKIVVLSKRPTKIVKEFEIETNFNNRDMNSNKHIELRKEIINYLTNRKG